jgi:mono/diheme cytochrome c family protein
MRRKSFWILAALVLALAACGGDGGQPAVDVGDAATLGQRTFDQWCVPCHGAGGEGFVNALNAPALNASGESHLLTDEAILAAIIDGGAASGGVMAPLGDQLSEEQERAVLEYVHTLWTDEQRAAHDDAGGHVASSE